MAPLAAQIDRVREAHRQDLDAGFGAAWLPHALARKYPNAASEIGVADCGGGGVRSPLDRPER